MGVSLYGAVRAYPHEIGRLGGATMNRPTTHGLAPYRRFALVAVSTALFILVSAAPAWAAGTGGHSGTTSAWSTLAIAVVGVLAIVAASFAAVRIGRNEPDSVRAAVDGKRR